jgi:hypothetical protein
MNKKDSLIISVIQTSVIIIMVTLLFLTLFRPDLIHSAIQATGIWSQSIGHWNALLIFFVSSIESFPAIGVLVPGQQVLLVIGGFY